ncbi:MAG: MFS transporter [Microbacteriaceae bacterium]
MPQPPTSARAGAGLWRGRVVALLAILFIALSLRSAVAAISPIVEEVSRDIPLSSVGFGVIGMLPPVFFALAGLIAPPVARRIGLEAALVAAIAVMILGHLVRAFAGDYAVLLLGTAIALVGMGIGNVLLPPAVKRYFPDRIGTITATYATLMSVSTALPALLAAPIADSIGWRFSLGIWSGLAIVALMPWLVLLGRHRAALSLAAHDETPERELAPLVQVTRVWRSPTALAITLAFAVSSINAYAAFAWLPQILRDTAGVDAIAAGSLLALFSFAGLPASIVAPILVVRLKNAGLIVYAGVVFFIVGYCGLLFVPATATWLWVLLIGLGPIMFPVCLVLINSRTRGHEGSVALSGFVQGAGYTIGALGPLLVGVLHDSSGGWHVPLLVLLGTGLTAVAAGVVIGRGNFIEDELGQRISSPR